MKVPLFWSPILAAALLGTDSAPRALAASLENDLIRADFDTRGLTTIHDKPSNQDIVFTASEFTVTLNSVLIDGTVLVPVIEENTATRHVFRYTSGTWTIRAIYELQPGWRFVSKHLSINSSAGSSYQLGKLEVLRGQLSTTVAAEQTVRDGRLLRFGSPATYGLLVTVQNPFLEWTRTGQQITVAYTPTMAWNPADGDFGSDRLLLVPYALSGLTYPAQLASWIYVADGTQNGGTTIDNAEIEAYRACVRAFIKAPRNASIRVHIGWTENDYQVDVSTAAGRTEYKRIIDQAAAVGCGYALYTPANSLLAPTSQNTDDWNFEDVLWLNLGQKIRKGEWIPGTSALPSEVTEMLAYAQSKNVKLLSYVYPTLPFTQDPAWTNWPVHRADTGQRSFQDWLVQSMVDFHAATGIGGFSFDHWFIDYSNAPSSKYAQWYGCRRILEELRRRLPDIVIDGRQVYFQYGPWSWLAGSYPHPLFSDEQPVSFESFPDLHWSRCSADRQRYISWYYRNVQFCPVELLPGYMTQQTPRQDAANVVRRDTFRARDWDLLGWKYSVISAIATAPFNYVVNLLPARDAQEFAQFSSEDKQWMRDWFNWTDANIDTLRLVRPILNQPQLGRVDGTAAFKNGHGFIFIFNPNYRALHARFVLNSSIGLESGGPFVLRQLYPDAEKGKLIAPPAGTSWQIGNAVDLPISGASALVLEVDSVPTPPVLFNSTGSVTLAGDRLQVSGAQGEPGATADIRVLLPSANLISTATVNGVQCRFLQQGNVLTIPANFPGTRFAARQQIGVYLPAFTGGTYTALSTIPQRVFTQLAARAQAWPIPYTAEELQATWLGSNRLMLFVSIADPDPAQTVSLRIDGQTKTLTRAYSSITGQAPGLSFTGWYADVSSLTADVQHSFEVTVPTLAAGRFQGMYFDTVEAEFATAIQPGTELVGTTSITDNFNSNRDYLTTGVSGTIWDGLYTGAGSIANTGLGSSGAGSTSVANANITNAGEFTVTSTRTDWEDAADDGFFLFRNVAGNFRVQVYITNHNTTNYNHAGLMARAPALANAAPGEDYLLWGVFEQLGWGNYLRSNVGGVANNFPITSDGIIRHYLMMERVGDTFNFYHRASTSDPWTFYRSIDRPDLAGLSLQVGLEHATFSASNLTTRFDDFTLESSTSVPLATPQERWRSVIFGMDASNPAIAGDNADPDGDGMTNAAEFIALTNPLDSSDRVRATVAPASGNGFAASISGKAGRIYALERNPDMGAVWTEVSRSPLLQTDALVTITDPTPPQPKAFYRFRIISP